MKEFILKGVNEMKTKTLPIIVRSSWMYDDFVKKLKKLRLLAKQISIPGFRYKKFTVCLDDDRFCFGCMGQKITLLINGSFKVKLTDEEIHKYEKVFNYAAQKMFKDHNIRTFINHSIEGKFIGWYGN